MFRDKKSHHHTYFCFQRNLLIHTLVVPSAKAIKIEWNVAGKEEKGEGGSYQYVLIVLIIVITY